jgi:acid phosphatase
LRNMNQPTNFWSCSSPRDIATAEWFADGFFGLNWTMHNVAKLHIIPETSDRGGDTLTPGDTCLRYVEDKNSGHDQGYYKVSLWQDKFTKHSRSAFIRKWWIRFLQLGYLQYDGDV